MLLGEAVGCCGAYVVDTGTETEGVFAWGSLPGLGGLVIGCQVVEREVHRERLTLVGLQFTRLGKGLEFASKMT